MAGDLPEGTIQFGKTEVFIPPLGTGTWQWGDRMLWGFGGEYTETDVKEAFYVSLEAGINFFDTAEAYGSGKSERVLGSCVSEIEQPVIIATKFLPLPWRIWRGALRIALKSSLKRLNMDRIDLYQIHLPMPPMPVEFWAKELATVVKEGLTRAVGVSNYTVDQMRRTHAFLAKEGVPLASNQVEYSLVERSPERNGLLAACNELGITLIAYSPLGKGTLTGKYTPDHIPPGLRARRYNRGFLERLQPLIYTLREIGQAHASKTPAQVALNWCICKGTVPIPGSKNARQAHENTRAVGWRLTEDEIAILDEASSKLG